jgi:hypothetical protein
MGQGTGWPRECQLATLLTSATPRMRKLSGRVRAGSNRRASLPRARGNVSTEALTRNVMPGEPGTVSAAIRSSGGDERWPGGEYTARDSPARSKTMYPPSANDGPVESGSGAFPAASEHGGIIAIRKSTFDGGGLP